MPYVREKFNFFHSGATIACSKSSLATLNSPSVVLFMEHSKIVQVIVKRSLRRSISFYNGWSITHLLLPSSMTLRVPKNLSLREQGSFWGRCRAWGGRSEKNRVVVLSRSSMTITMTRLAHTTPNRTAWSHPNTTLLLKSSNPNLNSVYTSKEGPNWQPNAKANHSVAAIVPKSINYS